MATLQDFNKAREMLGQTVNYTVHTAVFKTTIKDVAFKYGRIHYLLVPVAGTGEMWTQTFAAPKRPSRP